MLGVCPINDELISLKAPERYAWRRNPKELSHDLRTHFMRDRDRIVLSRSFRRLSGKTQMVLAYLDDHTRTRLTHTLEVALLAKTVASLLKLDVDLAESIALGHDLGHTPFGHAGEQTLNNIMNGCDLLGDKPYFIENEYKGFKHNLQGLRLVVDLERPIKRTPGLNLTNYTLFGIREHTKAFWPKDICKLQRDKGECIRRTAQVTCPNNFKKVVEYYQDYNKYLLLPDSDQWAWSFEAYVVNWFDEIAQRHHDLEDGLEIGIITEEEILHHLRRLEPFILAENDQSNYRKLILAKDRNDFQPDLGRFITNLYTRQLFENSLHNLTNFIKEHQLTEDNWSEFYSQVEMREQLNSEGNKVLISNFLVEKLIAYSKEFKEADSLLQRFLKNRLLNSAQVQRMNRQADNVIRTLFSTYLNNPMQLPDRVIYVLYKNLKRTKRRNLVARIWDYLEPRQGNERDILTIISGKLRRRLEKDMHEEYFKPYLFRAIADYIAEMTDEHALTIYRKLYG